MMKYLLFCILMINAAYAAYPTLEQNSNAQIIAVRTKERIVIDGKLTEKIWQVPGFNTLIQQDPEQGVKPTQKTEFWVAYDDDAVYFAARLYDTNPDSIMARLVRRDYIWGDPSDGCVLYLDSYRDKRNGYFFYVSAAGAVADGLIENDTKQPNDLSWDAVWEGARNIDDKGWSVEMKIPYSQLRFKAGDKQVWGINVERFISRRFETDMVVYTPRDESGFTSRFPNLTGFEKISPSAGIEFLPYVVGKAEYIGSSPNDPFNSGHEYSPGFGLDMRAGLGRSLTLNATVNPDFGQVEVDPAVVNLSDVESTFEEKRPFFTEGVSIYKFGGGGTNNDVSFNWPVTDIFYSRRIGRNPQGSLPAYDYADIPNGTHILGAAKISGQIYDGWKIGTLHAVTQREYAELSLNGERSSVEMEPLTYYGVVRIQRDFNSGKQGFGILSTFTDRFFKNKGLDNTINKNAFVVGSDGWTFLDADNTYVLTGWAALSSVTGTQERITALQVSPIHYFQRPDASYLSVDSTATSLTGYSGRLMLNKNRGKWFLNTAVGFISPQFEVNDLGFGSFSDYINAHIFTGYRWNDPTDLYQNCGINAAVYTSYDFGWDNTSQGYRLGGYLTRPDYSGGSVSFTYNASTLNARKTRGGPLTLNPESVSFNIDLFTDNRVWWVINPGGNASFGKDRNYYSIYTYLEFKVLPTLTLSVGPEFTRDISETQWVANLNDPEAAGTFNKRYLFAHLDQTISAANIRTDWILSPTLSFQVYLQPLIASGSYTDYKYLLKPKTYDYITYGESGSTLIQNTEPNGEISSYELDPDGSGPAPAQVIGNPDFNYISLRGNAVLRWEYLPGSTLYLVWTQSREGIEPDGEFQFGRSFSNLLNVRPDNIFMLKISYWL
jgi:hypothetical protein